MPDRDWLYPDDSTRNQRDPLRLTRTCDLAGLHVYLDTGSTDVNLAGCAALQQNLLERAVASENHVFAGTHSRDYCRQYMPEYLVFYGSN